MRQRKYPPYDNGNGKGNRCHPKGKGHQTRCGLPALWNGDMVDQAKNLKFCLTTPIVWVYDSTKRKIEQRKGERK